jgi:hypothetical protein
VQGNESAGTKHMKTQGSYILLRDIQQPTNQQRKYLICQLSLCAIEGYEEKDMGVLGWGWNWKE